jgi:hypothetical protein
MKQLDKMRSAAHPEHAVSAIEQGRRWNNQNVRENDQRIQAWIPAVPGMQHLFLQTLMRPSSSLQTDSSCSTERLLETACNHCESSTVDMGGGPERMHSQKVQGLLEAASTS